MKYENVASYDCVKKWVVLVLALFCVLGLIGCSQRRDVNNDSSLFGNGDVTVFETHREDFSPIIEDSILKQFENSAELKKAYILRTNDWFLSEDISDFSQVITTDIVYVTSGGEQGTSNDKAYSFYKVNEDGKIEWDSSAYPPLDASVPFGFSGLTYEMIDDVLDGVTYEDYIITYAQRLNTVFVWVRCESEDMIITYPTRPDLLGIEIGEIYTLEEVQDALVKAYNR